MRREKEWRRKKKGKIERREEDGERENKRDGEGMVEWPMLAAGSGQGKGR